ncbi:FAD-dependent thymidylate synthase [Persephonella atlantica]|uniref:FAD-dependent thymidylate synthase n=2 Tax=Persephonella atlantica TaxID=2699429 RepID=A0ABS1GJA3_9AQUI|nr:FAD-dependent thymidylate synthase [Persephonella atlantica]MBK3332832.1 FAD-dependent thymidylate synthase [Persephonella atlantica]
MLITQIFSLEDFKDTIPFTAIGARTCYSSGDLDYLLNDPRVSSREERARFLSKLGNYKHFSVFAHSFAYKDLTQVDENLLNQYLSPSFIDLPKEKKAEIIAAKIGATKFKSQYNPEFPTVIGVSLRHYLEDLLLEDEKKYMEAFSKMADFDIPVKPAGRIENTTLIGLITDYDGYAVFFIDNVSRTMTHQLVRHTALNYSQRSQRYVREDQNVLIIPPSVKEKNVNLPDSIIEYYIKLIQHYKSTIEEAEAKDELKKGVISRMDNFVQEFKDKKLSLQDVFTLTDQLCEAVYDLSVYVGKIKREDARFILPHGRKTTIVVSGTISWIKDFITKRTDPHAQWEIQSVANQMKQLLKEQGIDV